MFDGTYQGRRVLVTGHTGFKGSWLVSWLLGLGADVAGYALAPATSPSHFQVLGLEDRMQHHIGDIRNRETLNAVLRDFQPQIVFHLAAQALVRSSYADPTTTFETNTIGTMNVLDAVRQTPSVRALVVVTSDKCYRNVEWVWGYRESDVLGGEDPYSASKACAELVTYSYIHSFFKTNPAGAAVASARAGNVIGGGDWAADRIIPDCVRAWSDGKPVILRNPKSTRPWQHVLEPLSGYLLLGSELYKTNARALWQAYNFGPDATVNETVEALIAALAEGWKGAVWEVDAQSSVGQHEARLLKLTCDKALADLSWRPTLTLAETIDFTRQWYQQFAKREAQMPEITSSQIADYERKAANRGLSWAI